MPQAIITRVRIADVPSGVGNKDRLREIVKQVETNIIAGIGPQEALEIVNPYAKKNGGVTLMRHLKIMIAEKKYPVDVFVRDKEGRKICYVVGR